MKRLPHAPHPPPPFSNYRPTTKVEAAVVWLGTAPPWTTGFFWIGCRCCHRCRRRDYLFCNCVGLCVSLFSHFHPVSCIGTWYPSFRNVFARLDIAIPSFLLISISHCFAMDINKAGDVMQSLAKDHAVMATAFGSPYATSQSARSAMASNKVSEAPHCTNAMFDIA
jgi:hypothetical protein